MTAVLKSERELVDCVLNGTPHAARSLIEALAPVIQNRVARVLLRSGRSRGRTTQQEVDDLTQEVFAFLFEARGKTLRAWDSARGLSLEGFVGLVAERQVASILRGRRSPWTEDPTIDEELVELSPQTQSPELRLASRELLAAILARLPLELSPKGMHLFQLLLVEEKSVEEVAGITGLSADAVYAWKSRLAKRIRQLASEIEAGSAPEIVGASEVTNSLRKPQ